MSATAPRVLLASFVPGSRFTGMGGWSHAVAEALARSGHETTLWFAEDFPAALRAGRLAFVAAPVAVARRLVQERARFDVAVVHEACAHRYGAARRRDRTLPPLVTMCHNVESKVREVIGRAADRGLAVTTPWAGLSGRLLRAPRTDGAIRGADHVVCLSGEDRGYIVERLGVPADRVTVMTNGVGAERFRERTTFGGTRLLFVGGWLDVKGRRVLPPLFAALGARRPDATLTIVAPGDPRGILEAFAPGLRERITVEAASGHVAISALFERHDCLCMPSLSEGSPLLLLEAMAAGFPVVASRRGGIPDLVTHEREALLFEPFDPAEGAAMADRLLGDPALARHLADAAQDRARGLTWDAAAATLARTIQRLRSGAA